MNEPNPVGRPRMYDSPEELQKKIDEYFDIGCNTRKIFAGPKDNPIEITVKIPTITGLVLYCGFCDRSSFYEYEQFPEFTDTIKNARTRIEQDYEEDLKKGLGAGAIFALKNFGWIDKQDFQHSGGVAITQMPVIKIDGKPQELNIG